MKEIIILDIETTGIDDKKDAIIEIAAVKVSGFSIVDRFQSLVAISQDTKLTPTIISLTGITPEDLVNAPELKSVLAKLSDFAGDLPILGHNISFDLDFLKAKGLPLSGTPLDTLELAHVILPKLRFYSLEYLSYYYKFTNQPSHRAMNDVLATNELYELLISQIQNLSAKQIKQFGELATKSHWDWAFAFTEKLPKPKKFSTIPERENLLSESMATTAKDWLVKSNLQVGFNITDLAPSVEQIPFNIALAKELENSILVVHNQTLYRHDWSKWGLNPYRLRACQLDNTRLQFALNKELLDQSEVKLLIKVLAHGFDNNQFNYEQLNFNREEFYLFEQKLSPIGWQHTALPKRGVIDFATFHELLIEADNLLKDKTILLPEWSDFETDISFRAFKFITPAYLNAVVSSRRGFVHDYITDHQISDKLFKELNDLGANLAMTPELLTKVWNSVGKEEAIELENVMLLDEAGKALIQNITAIIEILTRYRNLVVSAPNFDQLMLNHQLSRTDELIEYFRLIINPDSAFKIYLNARNGHATIEIAKSPIVDLWQTKLKDLCVVIATNSALINNSSDFISKVVGQKIEATKFQDNLPAKELIYVRELPLPDDFSYQKTLFQYLKNLIDQEQGKVLIVMPNLQLSADFFNEYFEKLSTELISWDTAGNREIFKKELSAKNQFAMVASFYNLRNISEIMPPVDKVIIVKIPFESPVVQMPVLATGKYRSSFADYSLPKSAAILRETLPLIYAKTKEIWMLDSRLLIKDYGQVIRKSLLGFTPIEE